MSLSQMRPHMSDICLMITIFGSVACLAPLVSIPNTASYDAFDDESDTSITKALLMSKFYRETLSAGLYIVVIPTADLTFELFQNLWAGVRARNPEDRVVSRVIRLTNFERFLFILGVVVRSASILVPVHNRIIQLVFDCTNNSSTILITCPVMVFFARCTSTWTPSLTMVTISLTVISNMMEVCSFFYTPDSSICINLLFASQLLVFIAIFLVFALTLTCLYKYTKTKLGRHFQCPTRCKYGIKSSMLSSAAAVVKPTPKKDDARIIDELYENYVPGVHMSIGIMVSLAYLIAAIARKAYPSMTPEIGGYENVWILICAIFVLIVEYRIRGNEVTRGLIREKLSLTLLLDSKKSYVRYISHELRTPLNTTFLGMRLLIKEFQMNNDSHYKEHLETLIDMSLSCTAALDILNDLLCFEKLESGILDLHKQEVLVMPFLHDCINMFSVQAREGAITMSIDTEIDNIDCEFRRSPDDFGRRSTSQLYTDNNVNFLLLEDSDVVMMDRFKMDQVIRNLISNALKFTPRGGSISVKVTFVPNTRDTSVYSDQKSFNPYRMQNSGRETSWSNSISCLYTRNGLRSGGRRESVRRNQVAVSNVYDWNQNMDIETNGIGCPSGPLASIPCSLDSMKSSTIYGKLVIIVTDSGAGISENNQKRLFKEIVQFQPEILQAGGGSGLGLWITRGIVDLHDGMISVYSAGEGKGCSFTLEIPMERAPPGLKIHSEDRADIVLDEFQSQMHQTDMVKLEEGVADESDIALDAAIEITELVPLITEDLKLNILVVDDSRLNRKMLLKCLKGDGHICEEAEDGFEAVQKVIERSKSANGKRNYDAILMDFIMPNMDGPTATREIRALGYTAPIFGVTGNGLTTDIAHFMMCGVDEVLLKPLNVIDFYIAMKKINLM